MSSTTYLFNIEDINEALVKETIKEVYDAYTKLTNLATSPSGSLQTYSENFNAADSEVVNCYEAMQMYID